jgi:Tol biopolymer transport system component
VIRFSRLGRQSGALAAILAWSCGPGGSSEPPPYSSPERLPVPRIFGLGIVSTEIPEFATSFSPTGRMVFFNVATPDRSRLTMMSSRFDNGRWDKAMPLPFAGTFRDVDPFMSWDGKRLFFSSNRPIQGTEPKADFDTWYVERKGSDWGAPVRLESPVNSDSNDVFVSSAKDGTLYFASNRHGNSDIYRSRMADGRYSEPEVLGFEINTNESESNPAIAPDQSFLIFSAERPNGVGGADLYISFSRQGQWTLATNLGPGVNSPQADFAPYVSPDGKYLFFTSERPGVVVEPGPGRPPGDIYQVDISAVVK